MSKTIFSGKYGVRAAFTVGFLFIVLGTSTQAETSWLFTLGGMLALCQGLYDRHQAKRPKKD